MSFRSNQTHCAGNPLASVELQDPESLAHLNDIDLQRLRNGLEQLRRAGFNLWFDDYQPSYVGQLRHLNYYFDGIKLDRSDFLANRSSPENLKAIITQAREFGQLILIEGIESAEDLQIATQSNADLGQGFYWPEMKVAC